VVLPLESMWSVRAGDQDLFSPVQKEDKEDAANDSATRNRHGVFHNACVYMSCPPPRAGMGVTHFAMCNPLTCALSRSARALQLLATCASKRCCVARSKTRSSRCLWTRYGADSSVAALLDQRPGSCSLQRPTRALCATPLRAYVPHSSCTPCVRACVRVAPLLGLPLHQSSASPGQCMVVTPSPLSPASLVVHARRRSSTRAKSGSCWTRWWATPRRGVRWRRTTRPAGLREHRSRLQSSLRRTVGAVPLRSRERLGQPLLEVEARGTQQGRLATILPRQLVTRALATTKLGSQTAEYTARQ